MTGELQRQCHMSKSHVSTEESCVYQCFVTLQTIYFVALCDALLLECNTALQSCEETSEILPLLVKVERHMRLLQDELIRKGATYDESIMLVCIFGFVAVKHLRLKAKLNFHCS